MVEFNSRSGDHIEEVISDMINESKAKNTVVYCFFNGVRTEVFCNSDKSLVLKEYHDELNRRHEEYRKTPEYAAQVQKDKEKVSSLEDIRDELMIKLQSLDMTNLSDVLDWFCAMQDPSDHINVSIDKELIISTFENAGFKRNENTGKEFKEDDNENYARYIIGQCLDGLYSVGAIHYMAVVFTGKWKAKFQK